MKTRVSAVRLPLSRRFFATLTAVTFVLAAPASVVRAQTPVDVYQDMESGKAGDPLTPELAAASSHGTGSWRDMHGSLWISTEYARALPGPVAVGGKTFAGKAATRTWTFKNTEALNFAACVFKGSGKITVACYYTPCVTTPVYNNFDTIVIEGPGGYAVLQTINSDGKGPYIRVHSCSEHYKTTVSPGKIKIVSGKTYWVNLHFDGAARQSSVAVFDPEKGFAQVGETTVAESCPATITSAHFGRADNHGNNPNATTQSYFGQILVDYTNGAFTLIPQAAPPAGAEKAAPAQSQGEKKTP